MIVHAMFVEILAIGLKIVLINLIVIVASIVFKEVTAIVNAKSIHYFNKLFYF